MASSWKTLLPAGRRSRLPEMSVCAEPAPLPKTSIPYPFWICWIVLPEMVTWRALVLVFAPASLWFTAMPPQFVVLHAEPAVAALPIGLPVIRPCTGPKAEGLRWLRIGCAASRANAVGWDG